MIRSSLSTRNPRTLCHSLLQHPYSYIHPSSQLIRYKKQLSDCRMITSPLPMSTFLTHTSCVHRFMVCFHFRTLPFSMSPVCRVSSTIINKRNFNLLSCILQGRLSTLILRFDYRNQFFYLSSLIVIMMGRSQVCYVLYSVE